ncbi:MAG: cobalt-precorrin-5B (C(1))-methyltransferase [Prevotella sp.]|nr:cobalt-precorrin-5B (C(1))-methyltransferase [Prevotella sp.]
MHQSQEGNNVTTPLSLWEGQGGGALLIFGGTTEGRLAVDVCEQAGKPFYYSTKGDLQKVDMHNGVHITGAMTADDIVAFCKEHKVGCIVDAAHPFAENLHKTIDKARKVIDVPVIRLQRIFPEHIKGVEYCSDYDDAINKIREAKVEKLLALTGANTIKKLRLTKAIFRILNRPESIALAEAAGLDNDRIIFYNESLEIPSIEDEKKVMSEVGCDAIITKESGESGGFEVKVKAALELGLKVFVVEHPQLPKDWITVTGKYGLRRVIEHLMSDFFPLKTGFTTGACATAATKAAALSLLFDEYPEEVHFALPDGEIMTIPVTYEAKGVASVIKDSSDDPDVTKGCKITSTVTLEKSDGFSVKFLQGEGVGKVTLPGLGIPVGGPAVNPTPRKMIENELRAMVESTPSLLDRTGGEAFLVTISVENGAELALKTFNHKVGVVGGISIIGTSGIVSPLSNEAFVQSIRRELDVAWAIGCRTIGLVAGMKSEKALEGIRCVHYGNFVGEALKAAREVGFEDVHIAIMIGKAVKLAEGHLDTHSHKVLMNQEFIRKVAEGLGLEYKEVDMARDLWNTMPPAFFEEIRRLCYETCRTVYKEGKLTIHIVASPPALPRREGAAIAL